MTFTCLGVRVAQKKKRLDAEKPFRKGDSLSHLYKALYRQTVLLFPPTGFKTMFSLYLDVMEELHKTIQELREKNKRLRDQLRFFDHEVRRY